MYAAQEEHLVYRDEDCGGKIGGERFSSSAHQYHCRGNDDENEDNRAKKGVGNTTAESAIVWFQGTFSLSGAGQHYSSTAQFVWRQRLATVR
jgi:hypothetical protein